MKTVRLISKLVLFAAVLALLLGLAAIASAEECTTIQHVGPIYVAEKVEATCTVNGWQVKKCRNCGETIATEPIIAQGHRYGDVTNIITPATCTTKGQKQILSQCSVCLYVDTSRLEDIEPLGHNYPDVWTITKQPTCEETGSKQRVCRRDSSHVETEPISALGHDWGTPVTTPATCIAGSTTTATCKRDPSHKSTTTSGSPDMVNGHVWGNWQPLSKATCMTPAKEVRICRLDSSHRQERTVGDVDMKNGHQWDDGTVVKEPTTTSGGEILYVCDLNSSHTKTVKTSPLARGGNNTICAFGPRLRDTNLYPNNTDEWYMFTPFDASQDGVQTYDLIATNKYIVGTVTLTIQDGNLKVDYTLLDPANFKISLEFFTVLNRINDLPDYEPENLGYLNMPKGEFFNLAEKFGEDTNLVLYFCTRCNFVYSNKLKALDYNSFANQRLLQNMLALMD